MRTFEQKWNDEKFEKRLWRRLPEDMAEAYAEYAHDADMKQIKKWIRNAWSYDKMLKGLKEDWLPLINGKVIHTPVCIMTPKMVNEIRVNLKDHAIGWGNIREDDTIADMQIRAYGELICDCIWRDMGLGAECYWDDGVWLKKLKESDITADEAESMTLDEIYDNGW